ncbi:UDP-glucoronosyl and UDP-glucosyl transferase domain-containing protein [Ditylenchus destructor]|uniref:glucuronosyltransferase n=1 Tax=Ditylenchus destructor TaxID=166010 RepID=A0AAD4N027_9BILA|nr:UDP-glucoronosyl and UDP-glucosyl transferase domain-containing protein [Ditylenchus destructor]
MSAALRLSLLLSLFSCAFSAKILFFAYHDTGSHFNSMAPFFKRLASRGHQVALFDTISKSPKFWHENVTSINVHVPHAMDPMALLNLVWNLTTTEWQIPFVFQDGDRTLAEIFELHPEKTVETLNADWDLVVTDDLFCAIGQKTALFRKRHLNLPYVIFSTTQMKNSLTSNGALGRNWISKAPLFSYTPTSSEDYFQSGYFWHRLYAFTLNLGENIGANILTEKFFLPNIARFGVPNFTWSELYKGSSMNFGDSVDRIGWPVSEGSEAKGIGSYCADPKNGLDQEMEAFMNDPKSAGTIYVAFGSYAQWAHAPRRMIDAFVTALNRLDRYRIIFSYNGNPIQVKDHVKLVRWAPQSAILSHPRTKLFLTHGGLKSVKEAICGAVPFIVMPLFAEQAHNSHMALALRLGSVLNKFLVTPEIVHKTIEDILNNPFYEERARKYREIFLDRPMPSIDEAVFYTEKILRTPNGRITFQRKGIDLSWAEFSYYELALFVIALMYVVQK